MFHVTVGLNAKLIVRYKLYGLTTVVTIALFDIMNRYKTTLNGHTDHNYTQSKTVVVTIMDMLAIVMGHVLASWATLQTGP